MNFWDIFSKDNQLVEDYINLKEELSTARDQIESLKAQLLVKNDQESADNSSAGFAFDFAAMNAFSIERLQDNDTYRTVIGFKNHEKQIGEWHFYCDLMAHEKLCSEFKKYLKDKNDPC